MDATTGQIQLKLSLSTQLNALLQAKAAAFGTPVTQFVKHLILKEVDDVAYPTYAASDWTQKRVESALKNRSKAISIDSKDLHAFFESL